MDTFEAASLSGLSAATGKKFFSVAEANRSIILVRRIAADIVRVYRRLCELHAVCKSGGAGNEADRTEKAREEYARTTDYLAELQEELDKIGCEMKDYQLGVVDFPAVFKGREICLCWRLGEDRVCHWHEVDAGYEHRRPIASEWR